MARRTQAQWRELIEQQRESGLTAAQFCRRHSINAKYFSLVKQKLKQEAGGFVQVTPQVASSDPVAVSSVKVRVVELDIPSASIGESLEVLLNRLGR